MYRKVCKDLGTTGNHRAHDVGLEREKVNRGLCLETE